VPPSCGGAVGQADASMYERFDKFKMSYNLLGNKHLRDLLMRTDNFMGGRYFAELIKGRVFKQMEKARACALPVGQEAGGQRGFVGWGEGGGGGRGVIQRLPVLPVTLLAALHGQSTMRCLARSTPPDSATPMVGGNPTPRTHSCFCRGLTSPLIYHILSFVLSSTYQSATDPVVIRPHQTIAQ